jgi:cytochrome c oxidase subunit II
MWRFAEQPEGGAKNPGISWFARFKPWIPDEHKLEMAWTVVPALILLYIAFAQVGTWAENKYPRFNPLTGADGQKQPDKQVIVAEVSARQFEWRIRYPSFAQWQTWKKDPKAADVWSKNRYADDLWVVNEFHCVKGHPALAYVKTLDVIHSFNLPQMRVKQDALPGKTMQAWFTPLKHNTVKAADRYGKTRWEDGLGWDPDTGRAVEPKMVWEIACAELCGWGHGRMVGKVFVHENVADFEDWLRHADREYNRRTPELAAR